MRTLVLLASACLAGGAIEAQETSQGRTRTAEEARRAETEATSRRDRVMQRFMVRDSAAMNRATLGVTLGGATTQRDTLGVFVEAVAEGGPAERAGIYEGHRIASINGIDVRATAADAGDAYLSGVGRHRLSKAMGDLSAGNVVRLRVWTGSGYRDVQVTSARFADVYKNQRFGGLFHYDGPGVRFGPAMEHLRIERPFVHSLEVRPLREVQIDVRPELPDKVMELRSSELPRTPLRIRAIPIAPIAPSIEATPRKLPVPRLAPTPAARRRFII